jgi:aspartate/methionine/tyrosine aminotransferase
VRLAIARRSRRRLVARFTSRSRALPRKRLGRRGSMAGSHFAEFAVERYMSENEQRVEFSLFAESGVHSMQVRELVDLGAKAGLLTAEAVGATSLNYPEVNGQVALRRAIAALYGEQDADRVLVTVGASEANYVLADTLLGPGDVAAVLVPTYKQFYGCAVNRGASVREFFLDEANSWRLDVPSLRRAVTAACKVVAIVNPNNPTGRVLDGEERAAIVGAARAVGAWLVVDEVYAGAETSGEAETRSFYGMYDKVVCVNSLSKAYGLPGLRLGWAIGPNALMTAAWRRHEYATISASMLGNRLGLVAVHPATRPQLIARSRRLIRRGWPLVQRMLDDNRDLFSLAVRPQASAMCFLRYKLQTDSMTLALRLVREKSILLVPGAAFGKEHHLRFSYALPEDEVRIGIDRLVSMLRQVQREEQAKL